MDIVSTILENDNFYQIVLNIQANLNGNTNDMEYEKYKLQKNLFNLLESLFSTKKGSI